jgi:hypothetical protein
MTASPALEARLSMLDEDLSGVLLGLEKLDTDLKDLGTAGRSQLGVRMLLLNKVRILQNKIRDLRTNLAQKPLAAMWIQYGDLRETGDQVYREFLEIVGGVAIRRRDIDEKICLMAQELVRGAVEPPSLTILAMGDHRVPNLSRLMRIRFSDRAVWTLPLTAHQFADLLIEDFREFKSFALQKAEGEVGEATPEKPTAEVNPELYRKKLQRNKLLDSASTRWEQMIADCIALFIVGPCYAGSAILFRFSPVAAFPETDAHALDVERAYVCLEMLRRLNKSANADLPYKDFIDWLEKLWAQMLADAGNSEVLTSARTTELDSFVADLYQILDQNLPLAQYPIYQDQYSLDLGGWAIATKWSQGWTRQAENGGGKMQMPDGVGESSKVRDALNAAWLCRSKLSNAGDVRELTQVVKNVCDKIIVAVYKPADTDSMSPAVQGPGGSRAR